MTDFSASKVVTTLKLSSRILQKIKHLTLHRAGRTRDHLVMLAMLLTLCSAIGCNAESQRSANEVPSELRATEIHQDYTLTVALGPQLPIGTSSTMEFPRRDMPYFLLTLYNNTYEPIVFDHTFTGVSVVFASDRETMLTPNPAMMELMIPDIYGPNLRVPGRGSVVFPITFWNRELSDEPITVVARISGGIGYNPSEPWQRELAAKHRSSFPGPIESKPTYLDLSKLNESNHNPSPSPPAEDLELSVTLADDYWHTGERYFLLRLRNRTGASVVIDASSQNAKVYAIDGGREVSLVAEDSELEPVVRDILELIWLRDLCDVTIPVVVDKSNEHLLNTGITVIGELSFDYELSKEFSTPKLNESFEKRELRPPVRSKPTVARLRSD